MYNTWTILIPTTPNRSEVLNRLIDELNNQIEAAGASEFIKIDIELDNFEMSIGEKRSISNHY